MHPSVIRFIENALLPTDIKGKRVLEVGSLDVNGSARPTIQRLAPSEYIGVDNSAGKSVDMVLDASQLVSKFGVASFDLVVSTEMLEHVEDWKPIVAQLKEVVKPNGLLVITTRSPGFPYHPYPIDVWRYTQGDIRAILCDLNIILLMDDPLAPGVFVKARKPESFKMADLSKVSVHKV